MAQDKTARLACFDQWAQAQTQAGATPAAALPNPTGFAGALASAEGTPPAGPQPSADDLAYADAITLTKPCKSPQHSTLSRFWELEPATDCGSFTLRGYRTTGFALTAASSVNRQPSSPNPDNSAAEPRDYQNQETRLQLSVRTKLAQNLLTAEDALRKDSLWFGYTQQSYWQLFNKELSSPFRSTDHEPELVYIYPSEVQLPGGWRMRYSGAAITHQSNGQSLPLSRSWNRVSLLAGIEQGDSFSLTGRVWRRISEAAHKDDNPDISHYIGRAELGAAWNVNRENMLIATLRHNLKRDARGSLRLEWLKTLGSTSRPDSGLRLHTQLFSGYGDSLLDYNRRRTVLNVGLSLVDF